MTNWQQRNGKLLLKIELCLIEVSPNPLHACFTVKWNNNETNAKICKLSHFESFL
jgi:hypothetical protein